MGHGHLVLFVSGRFLWPGTRIGVHLLARHVLLHYNNRVPDDLQPDRAVRGTLRRGGLASLSFSSGLPKQAKSLLSESRKFWVKFDPDSISAEAIRGESSCASTEEWVQHRAAGGTARGNALFG